MPLRRCLDDVDDEVRDRVAFNLKLLNDEEIILLSQNGKIAAYALEKSLGLDKKGLERAVRIRRALICAWSSPLYRLSY